MKKKVVLPQRLIPVMVTAEDIRKGNPGEMTTCPIAKALRRVTGVRNISVDTSGVDIGKYSYKCKQVTKFKNFISNFDCYKIEKIKPTHFTFQLIVNKKKK